MWWAAYPSNFKIPPHLPKLRRCSLTKNESAYEERHKPDFSVVKEARGGNGQCADRHKSDVDKGESFREGVSIDAYVKANKGFVARFEVVIHELEP